MERGLQIYTTKPRLQQKFPWISNFVYRMYPRFSFSLNRERFNAMSKRGGRMLLPDPLFHLGIVNRTIGRLLVWASPSGRCSSRNHILGSCLTHSADDNYLTSSAVYGIFKILDIYDR